MAEGGGRVSSGRTTVLSLRHSPIKIKEIRFSGSKISLKANYIAIGSGSAPDEIDTSVPDPEWDHEIAKRIIRYIPGNRMTGEDVRRVQAALLALGISVGPNGDDSDYGSGTKAGVEEFQRQYGLGVDGKVGPEVRGALGLTGPAAYPIGTEITVDAKFTTSNTSITSAKIRAVDGRNGFGGLGSQADPTQPVTVNFSGGESTGGVGNGFYRFKIRRAPTYIKIHNVKWLWRCRDLTGISARGEGNAGTSHHHVYITYRDGSADSLIAAIESTPYSIQRMRWACKWAENGTDESSIGDKIQRAVNYSNPPYFNGATGLDGGSGCTTIWHMMKSTATGDQYSGSCSAHANLMVHAAALLGISGQVAYIYPKIHGTDLTTITGIDANDNQRYTTMISGVDVELCPYVMTSSHAINNYEGAAFIDGRYYAGAVDRLQGDSPEQFMRRYATFQGRYAAWNNWDGPDNVGDEWYGKDSPIQFYGDEPSDVPRNKRLNVYDP